MLDKNNNSVDTARIILFDMAAEISNIKDREERSAKIQEQPDGIDQAELAGMVDFIRLGAPFPTRPFSEIVRIPVEWLVRDIIIAGTIVLISGQPKAKKTWLSLELAVSIATKRPAFGTHDVSKRGSVLYFNAEDSPEVITKARFDALLLGKGLKDGLGVEMYHVNVASIKLDNPDHQRKLESTVASLKPHVLVLDPLRNLYDGEENSSTAINPVLTFLRVMVRIYGLTIILVSHDRKPSINESGTRASKTRGSNAIDGARDTAIFLDTVDENTILLTVDHRGAINPNPFNVKLTCANISDGELISAQFNLASDVRSSKQNEIIGFLQNCQWEFSKTELAKKVGGNYRDVLKDIDKLLSVGVLTKRGSKIGLSLLSKPPENRSEKTELDA